MSPSPLYRPEVLEAKRNRWLGSLVIRQPFSHWAMTWAAVALAALVVIVLYNFEYARKVRIEGRLVVEPAAVDIVAPNDGALESIAYEEGEWVDRAMKVATIRSDEPVGRTHTTTVLAPLSGYVIANSAQASGPVNRGQVLLKLRPEGAKLEAELAVPERVLGAVVVGTEVFLRYRAYPYQRYGQYRGRILRIARAPSEKQASAGATAMLSPDVDETYRAVVALDAQAVRDERGEIDELRPGLEVEADLVVEKRPLYEWILAPLTERRRGERG